MNRSRKVFNQGLAALLVLMLVMPFSALAESHKKTQRAKQRTAKTVAPETDKQNAQTPDKGETKTETKSEVAKPSANDETAPPVIVFVQGLQNQTQDQTPTQTPAQDQPIKRSNAQPPADRVGVDLNNPLNLSIHDAV